jgi:hypothetical protein
MNSTFEAQLKVDSPRWISVPNCATEESLQMLLCPLHRLRQFVTRTSSGMLKAMCSPE